jgi:phosphoglycerate kinase
MPRSFPNLLEQSLQGKVVMVRVDFNVPLLNGQVADNTRILASVPTIQALIDRGAKVVLVSHLSRPNGKVDERLRLNPIRDALQLVLDRPVQKMDVCIGDLVQQAIDRLQDGDVLLLENIRFYAEEMVNDSVFSQTLASYADYFVQDAFGAVHRQHASTYGIPQCLPAYSGKLLDKEIDYLGTLMCGAEAPFVTIIGGSKISTKFSVLENLLQVVDVMVLGGAMVYTLLKAQGYSVGKSLVEDNLIPASVSFLQRAVELNKTVYIPQDHCVVKAFDQPSTARIIASDAFQSDDIGVDIGPQSIQHIQSLIQSSNTVFWNGPVGVFETKEYAVGTDAIAKTLAGVTAKTVVGGGDSIAALNRSGYADSIDHMSTGGGASLEFLEGKVLPGISVLHGK